MRTRDYARTGLAVVAWLFAALLLIQIFLAGLGVFDDPRSFVTHREFGYGISWLILAMIVLAVVGRVPRAILGLCVLLAVQIILQSVFVAMRGSNPAVAALHPVNGVLMLVVTLAVARGAWQIRSEGRFAGSPAPTPAPVPTGAGPEA